MKSGSRSMPNLLLANHQIASGILDVAAYGTRLGVADGFWPFCVVTLDEASAWNTSLIATGHTASCLGADSRGTDSTDEKLLVIDIFENNEPKDDAEESAEIVCCPPPEDAIFLVGDSGTSISVVSSSESSMTMTLGLPCDCN